MNKTIVLQFLILILFPVFANAQLGFKIEDFSGIWKNDVNYMKTESIDESTDGYGLFIFNETDILEINFYGGDIYLHLNILYFLKAGMEDSTDFGYMDGLTQDVNKASKYIEFIDKEDLTDPYSRTVKNWSEFRYGSSYLYEFEPQSRMILDDVNSHQYYHQDALTKKQLFKLYEKCKIDSLNYIKDYLELDVRNIYVEKSTIYDSLEVKTKMYLVKDDLITVTGEQNSFLKMEYETANGNIINGLVKKEDVEGISVKE